MNRAPCLALQPSSPHFGKDECPECYERRRFPSDETCEYDRTYVAPIVPAAPPRKEAA
jgi:hypothetical protein